MEKIPLNIINPALLWEYDLETFNYVKSYKIVIERILQMGNLEEWRNMVKFYSKEQILETIEWSEGLYRHLLFAPAFQHESNGGILWPEIHLHESDDCREGRKFFR